MAQNSNSRTLAYDKYANISKANTKSILLFEKNGYIRVGLKKDWIFYNNKFNDELLFQKILNT